MRSPPGSAFAITLSKTRGTKAADGFAARGYPVIQSGRYDEDEHYYLDTAKNFGYVLELGNAGKIRPGIRRYPA